LARKSRWHAILGTRGKEARRRTLSGSLSEASGLATRSPRKTLLTSMTPSGGLHSSVVLLPPGYRSPSSFIHIPSFLVLSLWHRTRNSRSNVMKPRLNHQVFSQMFNLKGPCPWRNVAWFASWTVVSYPLLASCTCLHVSIQVWSALCQLSSLTTVTVRPGQK
jgi:hypothetical protein